MTEIKEFDIMVIGCGMAGMTCASYLATAGRQVAIVGNRLDSSLALVPEVTFYPGLTTATSGKQLLERLHQQTVSSGVIEVGESALAPMNVDNYWMTPTDQGALVKSSVLVLATGSRARLLNLENEEQLLKTTVITNVYRDAEKVKDKNVLLVGSGTRAVQQATYLCKFAAQVTMILPPDHVGKGFYTNDHLLAYPNLQVLTGLEVGQVQVNPNSVLIRLAGNLRKILSFNYLVYALGSVPNTEFLQGVIPLSDSGYFCLGSDARKAQRIYACGDIRLGNTVKTALSAATDGLVTAQEILDNFNK